MEHVKKIRIDLETALAALPWVDVHTHIDAAHLSARGLDDILLYHMSISDLYAAGCGCGARLSENRTEDEAVSRLEQAVPYLPKTFNTFIAWGIRIILEDLYGWREPVTRDNWRRLHALIAERRDDPTWPREILKRAGIVRSATELWRGRDGSADDLFDYSLEWAFFSRTQCGQPDIPLYELERAWAETKPGIPLPVTFDRADAPPLPRTICNLDDLHEAVSHYAGLIPYGKVFSTATHFSTEIDYAPVTDAAMSEALRLRDVATDKQRDVYASYITHALLDALSPHGSEMAFQFSLGAEPLPHESASLLRQRTIGQLAELINRFPSVRFVCFLSSRHANQSLCTLARELPNLSLAGYWWHNFFPGAIRHVFDERLDMLPLNKQIGFFSDAYCADWAYAKAVLVRKLMAEVLANRIDSGQYSFDDAVNISRTLVYNTPLEVLGIRLKK
ncbi:MAG TPA: hypothetical protein VMZ06_08205 [Candidatus Bathyarchaeia archaeon]|nr:hypothetical protein [Candidatus Bathyarchaeia archaeon]